MKKTLLFASLLLGSVSFAQLQQSNEPSIGDNVTMYLCDSFAPNYSNVTGSGVTWDYRGAGHEGSITKTITVVTPPAAYSSSSKGIEIQNLSTSYFSSSSTSRNSQGFELTQPTLGNIKIEFNTDDEKVMSYPFDVNGTFTDTYSGELVSSVGTFPCSGAITAKVDGKGTLKLNNATTLTNVLRYKLMDSTVSTTIIGTVKMVRTQYEYYDFTVSNLPVFVHATLLLKIANGAPNVATMVMNRYMPDGTAGITTNELAAVSVYPNPAKGSVSVSGLTNTAVLTLVDAQGKTVISSAVEPGAATLSLDQVTAGMYFLHVMSNNETTIQKVIVQ